MIENFIEIDLIGWWLNRVGETPGTIPNPEVKPHFADGTALATEWESRALPAFL